MRWIDMIPGTTARPPFPKNRTWFALLLMQKSGRAEIYHTLFFTEAEAYAMGNSMVNKRITDTYSVYPVQPEIHDPKYKPLWY
jgi:hypothetical protein|tara:strand:+ start:352 stop:600 length:249 start_codon:yes stop_codon:yes gene_type:complete